MNNFNSWFSQNYKGNEGKTLPYTDEKGNNRDILMKLAETRMQQNQNMNPVSQPVQAQPVQNTQQNSVQPVAQSAQTEDESEEDKKLKFAKSDTDKLFSNPYSKIGAGEYSTFQPEDKMASLRQQVLQNLAFRG